MPRVPLVRATLVVASISWMVPAVAEAVYTSTISGQTAVMIGDAADDTLIITRDPVSGNLLHNRFHIDAGFESAADFGSAVPGIQTLAASAGSRLIINASSGDDTVTLGSAASPASTLLAQISLNNSGQDGDTLTVDDSGNTAANTITITGTSVTGSGIGVTLGGAGFNGGRIVRTGSAGDTVNLRSVKTSDFFIEPHFIFTNDGADTINIGSVTNSLDGFEQTVTVTGGPGADTVDIRDQGQAGVLTYTVEGTIFTRTGMGATIRTNTLESRRINGGTAGNTYTVIGIINGLNTTITAQDGADTFTVGMGDSLDALLATLAIDAGGGTDALTLNDFADATPNIYTITPTYIGRNGIWNIVTTAALESRQLNGGTAPNLYNISGVSTNTSVLGGDADDSFVFADGAQVGGSLQGGGGANTLDYGASTSGVAANLGMSTSHLTGEFDADQEVPPTSSPATGTATFTDYNPSTRRFDIVVTVNGIAPAAVTGIHIHAAPYGVNGPIIIDFGTGALTPSGSGFTFVATNVPVDGIHDAALLGGLTYVNVHTAEFPDGAVRAQLFSMGNTSLPTGTATGVSSLSSIQNLIGGAADDSLAGTADNNTIRGGGGNDTIVGGPGGDLLQGEDGDDAIAWNDGDDNDGISGGLGADTVQVNGRIGGAPDLFSIDAGRGPLIEFVRSGTGPFTLSIGTVETLTTLGLAGDDRITVTNLATVPVLTALRLAGFSGADTIDASLAGSHLASVVIDGGTGGDFLAGTAGVDSIRGGPDGDVLTGLGGNDTMSGGAGGDAFLGGPGADTISGGADADTFTWNPGDGSDVIDGDAGTDHVQFNGAAGVEVFGVAASGARVRLTRSIGNIIMDIGSTETIRIDGLASDDVFNIVPQPGTSIDVRGGVQTAADTLNFDGQNLLLTQSAGTLTASGRQPVLFSEMETVNLLNPAPTVTLADVSAAEGTASNGALTFTLALSAASIQTVTLDVATANGTAATPGDYAALFQTVTFTPGQVTRDVVVTLTGESLFEADETLLLNLGSPTNSTLARAQATGTVTNDDLAPTVSIADVSLAEGNSGTTLATFTVTLSAASGLPADVAYTTANASAAAPLDYLAAAGSVTFAPGETTRPVTVTVNGDQLFEATETFSVTLGSPSGATMADALGVGTITNDDVAPTVSITDVALSEGNAGTTTATFTATLNAASGLPATVEYATANGTAVAPGDYAAASGSLSFAAGETTRTVAVSVIGDREAEAVETFAINLSTPVGVTITDGQGIGTITNDDVAPTVTITSPATTGAFTATSPFLTIAGTASDDFGIGSISWVNNRGGSGQAQGTTNWTVRDIPVVAGVNVITVTANDLDARPITADPEAGGDPNDPRLNTATAVLTVTVNEFTYFLAEGATGSFFDLDVLLGNPHTTTAAVNIRFLKDDGTTVVQDLVLAPQSRLTIPVETIAGLESTAVSTVVTSTQALPLVVERSMIWTAGYGSHTGSAVDGARLRWLFAEGSQGFFDTFVLLGNASATAANVQLTFLTEFDGPVAITRTVPPNARLTVWAFEVAALLGKSFSIVVDSDIPIIAERAMYFPSAATVDPQGRRLFEGGHESAGVSEPATNWFHAEGATGSFFDTYVLVGNPNAGPATVTFTWLLETGETVTRVKTIPGNSRLTVYVDAEDALLANAPAVSTTVASDVPVISERAMYWPGAFTQWFEAHGSFGVTSVATKWALAEGRVGGALGFDTFILLANPATVPAQVRVTYLRESGAPVVKDYTVGATSRKNIWANVEVPELVNERFAAIVEVLNGVGIAVERAMYNASGGVVFSGGTNATATRIP